MEKTDNKKKASHRKFNIKRLAVFVAAVLAGLYFSYTFISQQILIGKKDDEIKALNGQVEEATRESDRLKGQLENLQDPEYIEKIAREKLGLVRPNERVFVDSNKSENNSGN